MSNIGGVSQHQFSDTKSMVSEVRVSQREFFKRQEEQAKKSEELKRKLQKKYEFKPRAFKSRTPTR